MVVSAITPEVLKLVRQVVDMLPIKKRIAGDASSRGDYGTTRHSCQILVQPSYVVVKLVNVSVSTYVKNVLAITGREAGNSARR